MVGDEVGKMLGQFMKNPECLPKNLRTTRAFCLFCFGKFACVLLFLEDSRANNGS